MAGELEALLATEWLATNGLGGYGSGTLAGANTRRYHGLLVAALQPPVQRTLLVAGLDETLWVGPAAFALACHEYHDGTIHPDGYRYLAGFALERGIATWDYAFQGWRLRKQLWLEQGQNTTFVRYTLLEAGSACRLELLPLCTYRDFHAEQQGGAPFAFEYGDQGLRIQARAGAQPYWLACDRPAGFQPQPDWYWRFLHRVERERGLDDEEDLFAPGTLATAILPNQPVTMRLTSEPAPAPFEGAWERALAWTERWLGPPRGPVASSGLNVLGGSSPPRLSHDSDAAAIEARLRLAASQFPTRRGIRNSEFRIQNPPPPPNSEFRIPNSVLAGYHWFADWGRDTMISLPGLLLTTRRFGEAREVLRTFAGFVDRGMLPNTFDEGGGPAAYNNVDATLWFFHAIDRYIRAADDAPFLKEVFGVLEGIVDWHLKGTRFNIKADPADGLLFAGQEGVQLTWMDAKVGDWVVTPRIGKPVEVNALWFNAVCLMASWARELQVEARDYQELSAQISRSFRTRFWNEAAGCLYDVVDGPEGDDASVRPNQIFAVSLPFATLFGPQAKAVVDTVQARLLTPYGLRTLAPDDPKYVGHYRGDPWQRDGAYHQGTVWPWLIGPFVDAHVRVHRDPERAKAFLAPLVRHLDQQAGIGTISEIFDGDEPHEPRGCIAQAWSVAEVLRCWHDLHAPPPQPPPALMGGHNGRH